MSTKANPTALLDPAILGRATVDAFRKLDPRDLARNPVIFVTEVVAALVTILFIRHFATGGETAFSGQIAAWLWFTVLFANFAEAVAEGRGKAQAATLRRMRSDVVAKRLLGVNGPEGVFEKVLAAELRVGDIVLVAAGEVIPGDGEVVQGIASVNESAITGESAPVIRESGGDRSAVTGGTLVLSDWIKVKITKAAGSTFLDRMIALVEGAARQKTPNELALSILLSGLTLIFLITVVTLWGLAGYSGTVLSVTVLVALLVTLIPTTIGGLLSAIGIAGMDRLIRFNVVATSGRAVEAAGDVDTLLLDKTGTITFGNRMASAFIAAPGVQSRALAEAAWLASLADETPEGRSIVAYAKSFGFTEPEIGRVFSAHAHLRHRAQRPQPAEGRGGRGARPSWDDGGRGARRLPRRGRRDRPHRRHAARGFGKRRAARRHSPQGRREARHQEPFRGTARDGHQDGDGDRRQPGDRGGDCVGGGR
jgi:K+-transporting ATPase ATPase B chain